MNTEFFLLHEYCNLQSTLLLYHRAHRHCRPNYYCLILESFSRSHPFDTLSSHLDSIGKHYTAVGIANGPVFLVNFVERLCSINSLC